MEALPRFVALKSNYNGKYLSYINEVGDVHGFLRFSGEEVVSPYTKLEVEVASNGNGLVHIRCCYNNKYWARWSQNHWWIVAGADAPEEDQSKWSCTLFEPVYIDAQTARFRHVQLGHYACLWRTGDVYDSCLFAGSEAPDQDECDVCTIINWESLFILPKHIAFKGDNNLYLSARLIQNNPHLQFASSDIGDATVGNEVFITPDGSVRIKSHHFGRFWRRGSSDWILGESDDTSSNNSDTLFWPTKVDNHVVALRNLGNNEFCRRFTTGTMISCLSANVSSITGVARLEVEEIVLSRNINQFSYQFMDARTYNQSLVELAHTTVINTTHETRNVEVKLSYTESSSKTWNSSVSLKLAMITPTIQAGVPLIEGEGKINISGEFTGEYQWGTTVQNTTIKETPHEVTVPPMTTIKVTLQATMASCDVPFSYAQSDTLTNGERITYIMDDGIYTGTNHFNYTFKEETL